MTQAGAAPEFSFEIDLTGLSASEKQFRLKAEQSVCEQLAKRLGVIAVHSCEGEINLSATKSVINVSGTVRGGVTRECVASLEDMEEVVSDSFELEFFRNANALDDDKSLDETDLAEIHEGDVFDIGELLVQQFSLAMDPFPRKDNAPSLAEEYGEDIEASPFAGLQDILKKSN